MVGALECAAFVGVKPQIAMAALRIAVPVPAENDLQVQRLEFFQKFIGVERTVFDTGAKREMCENNCWPALVKARRLFIGPFKSIRLDSGLFVFLPFGGVQSDKLPSVELKNVIAPAREKQVVVAQAFGRIVIMVAGHGVDRAAQLLENVACDGVVFTFTVFGKIAKVQAEVGLGLFHALDDSAEPFSAGVAHQMGVVDNDELKPSIAGGVACAKRTGPQAQGEQQAAA